MADKKPKYQRIVSPVGVAVYPWLTKADTKHDPDGVFKTKLRVKQDDAADMIAELERIRDEFHASLEPAKRKKFKLADVCEVEIDEEGNETGYVVFSTKMKARIKTKSGEVYDQQPKFWDSQNNEVPIKGLSIWGGSRIAFSADVVPFAMESTKQCGVSLRLKQVQIVELVEGNGGESPFAKQDGYTRRAASEDDEPIDDDSGADF